MSQKIELPEEKLTKKTKLGFSFGSLANNILNGFVFANITFFYNQKLNADASLLAFAWLLFAIWNTVNDPIVSYFIDNTRTKIGRRIPYIRYGSFLYALAFIFCWIPIAPQGNQIALFFNFLLVLFLLDTMFSIVGCCFFCLPAEIAITAKGRASLGVYTSLIGLLNIVIGIILPIMLLTTQEGIPDIFYISIIILGILCALILFGTSYLYKENMFAQLQPHEPFIEGLRLTLKNKALWIFMVPAFFIAIAFPIFQTGLLYYIDYIISGLDLILFVLALIIGIIVGMAINVVRVATLGPKRIMIVNLAVISAGFMVMFIMGQNTALVAIPTFAMGFGFAGAMVSSGVIMGDVIDNDEVITGKRREAIYGGVNAIVTKPSLSIANWLFLMMLTTFQFVDPILVGDDYVKQAQSASGILGILIAFCLVPSILTAICALALYWYPLDGPEWLMKKKDLIELHQKKEQEYLQKLVNEGKLK
jgi:GPH family glycoside/pentoside/hexuronide:cation symporter